MLRIAVSNDKMRNRNNGVAQRAFKELYMHCIYGVFLTQSEERVLVNV